MFLVYRALRARTGYVHFCLRPILAEFQLSFVCCFCAKWVISRSGHTMFWLYGDDMIPKRVILVKYILNPFYPHWLYLYWGWLSTYPQIWCIHVIIIWHGCYGCWWVIQLIYISLGSDRCWPHNCNIWGAFCTS